MRRKLLVFLQNWKKETWRKPLILQGSRQVGKTYLIKEFGQTSYKNMASFNFETTPGLSDLFKGDLRPTDILKKLSFFNDGKAIIPNETLIFLDEIQQCEEAVTSLKYFCENAPEYHIIAAGSLLGVKLKRSHVSFPVGKVTLKSLYPLCFSEYLMAAGLNHYIEFLEDFKSLESLEPVFHQKLLEEFKTYMAIGGMPEAVKTYLDKKEFSATREVQNQILRTYELDFSKYAGATEAMRISQLWASIPAQIAKENQRFFFSAIKNSARSREYENSTQWLIDAGLVIRSTCVKLPNLPLSAYIESNIFKLFLLDVGLLGAQCKISPSIFVGFQEYFTHFKGSLFENYIAQELTAQSLGPLYYWKSKADAELDFILQLDNHIIPVEVKSGANRKSKSLKFYREKYKPTLAIKITPNRYSKKDALVELPVYATELISRLDQTSF